MDERAPKIEPKPKMVTCPSCKGTGEMSSGHCTLDFYGGRPPTVPCSRCKGMRKVEEEPEPTISPLDPTPEEEKAARDAVTEVGAHRMGVAVRRHLEIVFAQALAKKRIETRNAAAAIACYYGNGTSEPERIHKAARLAADQIRDHILWGSKPFPGYQPDFSALEKTEGGNLGHSEHAPSGGEDNKASGVGEGRPGEPGSSGGGSTAAQQP